MNLDLISAAFQDPSLGSIAPGPPIARPVPGIPATDALKRISDLYQSLQRQAGRIHDIYGAKIPCSVQARHNAAVTAYVRAARDVFDQVLQADPRAQILQQLIDDKGTVIGEKVGGRPVMPLTLSSASCPDTAMALTGLGAGPLLPLVARVVLWLIVGGTVVATASTVISRWPGSDIDAAEGHKVWVSTRLDCIKRLRADQNLSLEAAEVRCAKIAGDKPPQGSGSSLTVALVVGGAGLIVGGIIAVLLSRKSSSRSAPDDDGELEGPPCRRCR